MKIDWSAVGESAKANKGKILIVALAIALGIFALFLTDKCGTYHTQRSIDKKTAEIANNMKEISNIDKQISELEGNKAAKKEQIEKDTLELTNTLLMREEDKVATNQALANYNAALRSNSNVNATAEDLERQLRRLQEQAP